MYKYTYIFSFLSILNLYTNICALKQLIITPLVTLDAIFVPNL